MIADARTPGAAPILRETGAGWLVNHDAERDAARREALAATPETLARLAESGRTYVETRMGWRRAATKTAEAIDAFGGVDDGRSRETALAQLAYLLPLMRRQRRTIAAMQVSRFWRARNAWFALKRRLRMGPRVDPIPGGAEAMPRRPNWRRSAIPIFSFASSIDCARSTSSECVRCSRCSRRCHRLRSSSKPP